MSTQRIIKTINDTCRRTLVKIQNAIWSSYHIIYSTEGLTVKSGKLKHQNDSMEVQHCTQDEHSEDKAVLIWKAGCPKCKSTAAWIVNFHSINKHFFGGCEKCKITTFLEDCPNCKAQNTRHEWEGEGRFLGARFVTCISCGDHYLYGYD